jgi:hypothetical protein
MTANRPEGTARPIAGLMTSGLRGSAGVECDARRSDAKRFAGEGDFGRGKRDRKRDRGRIRGLRTGEQREDRTDRAVVGVAWIAGVCARVCGVTGFHRRGQGYGRAFRMRPMDVAERQPELKDQR